MKRTLTGIAAAAVVLGTLAPAAFAATPTSLSHGGGKTISLDGTTLYTGVQVGNATEAGVVNAYFPIYYLQQTLDKAGYTNTYDPGTHVWNLQIPGVDGSKVAVDGGVGSGNSAIAINGFVVKRFNAVWNKDLAGGPNAVTTTYFPLFYLTNTLKAAGFSSAWDGNNFGFTSADNYGAPAAVKLSASSSSLVANNATKDTITATVVDANGKVVRNFNGLLSLSADHGTLSETSGIKVTNGVATVTLKDSAVETDTISATALSDDTGYNYVMNLDMGTVAVSTAAPVATSISLTPATKTVSNNTGTASDLVTVNYLDQAGQEMASAGSNYVTFTLTGPGTFSNGDTTLSQYVSDGGTISVTPNVGEAGTISITAAAPGLTSGTASVSSVATTAPNAVKVSSAVSSTQTDANGVPYTIYTVTLVDKNGNPVAPSSDDALTITDNSSDTGASLQYKTVDTTGTVTSTALSAPAIAGIGNGTFQFAVANTTEGSGNVTLSISDALIGTTESATYTPAAGTVTHFAYTSDPSYVSAGKSVSYTLQAEDVSNNPVSEGGDVGTLYFVGGSNTSNSKINGVNPTLANPLHVVTDANGQVTFTVAVPSTANAGDTYEVEYYSTPYTTSYNSSVVTVDNLASTTTHLDLSSTVPTGTLTPVTWPTSSMSAGTTLAQYLGVSNIYVVPENAVNGYTGADTFKITTSDASVLSVNGGSSDTGVATTALNAITANKAGTATLTITDTSEAGSVTWTKTITVKSGQPSKAEAVNPDGTKDTAYTFGASGVSSAFTLNIYDLGGNVVGLNNGPLTLTAAEVESLLGVSTTNVAGLKGIRTSATGADVNSITVPAGQGTIQVYVDGVTKGDATVATSSSDVSSFGLNVVSAKANATNKTVTVTFDNPVTGTIDATQFTASTGSAASSAVISGNTIVLTFATAPSGTLTWTGTTGATTGYNGALAANATGVTIQ